MNLKSKPIINERKLRFSLLKNYNNEYYEIDFINDEVDYKIEDHLELVAAQKEMGGLTLPCVIICRDLTIINSEMLEYISKNENDPYSKADAFVISSMSQRILGNFYLKIVRPERPSKLFNNKEDALKWIQQFI